MEKKQKAESKKPKAKSKKLKAESLKLKETEAKETQVKTNRSPEKPEDSFDFGGLPERSLKKNLGCG